MIEGKFYINPTLGAWIEKQERDMDALADAVKVIQTKIGHITECLEHDRKGISELKSKLEEHIDS